MNFTDIEKIDSSKEEQISEAVFSSEITEPIKDPEISLEKNNGTLSSVKVDGKVLEGYEDVEAWELRNTLDPNIKEIFIREEKDAHDKTLTVDKYINIKNPEEAYPTISYGGYNNGVFVNGVRWDMVDNDKIIWGGHQVAFDIDNKKVVFATRGDGKNNSVVENNTVWKNKFSYISTLIAKLGHVGAIDSSDGDKTLFIDDKKWQIPDDKNKKNLNSRSKPEIRMFDMNKDTAAVAVSYLSHSGYKQGVYTGDMYGKNEEWKNTFYKIENLTVDKTQDTVAVIATQNENEEKILVINDIICKTNKQIHTLENFEISDGVVFVQYISPLGEQIAERIKLVEKAEEIQVRNLLKQQNAQDLSKLNFLLHTEGIAPEAVIEKIQKVDEVKNNLKEANKKLEEANNKMSELLLNLSELRTEKENLIRENNDKIASLENTIISKTETIKVQAQNLLSIKDAVTTMTKNTFGGGHTVSADEYENLKKILLIK